MFQGVIFPYLPFSGYIPAPALDSFNIQGIGAVFVNCVIHGFDIKQRDLVVDLAGRAYKELSGRSDPLNQFKGFILHIKGIPEGEGLFAADISKQEFIRPGPVNLKNIVASAAFYGIESLCMELVLSQDNIQQSPVAAVRMEEKGSSLFPDGPGDFQPSFQTVLLYPQGRKNGAVGTGHILTHKLQGRCSIIRIDFCQSGGIGCGTVQYMIDQLRRIVKDHGKEFQIHIGIGITEGAFDATDIDPVL